MFKEGYQRKIHGHNKTNDKHHKQYTKTAGWIGISDKKHFKGDSHNSAGSKPAPENHIMILLKTQKAAG